MVALAATGLAAALTLSGCFGNPIGDLVGDAVGEAAGKQVAEGLVEDMTGGDLALGEKPADFPSAIPVVDGPIVTGMKIKGDDGGTMWSLVIEFTDEGLVDTARQRLLDAGYEETSWGNLGGIITGTFEGADYGVQFGAFLPEGGDPGSLSYNVFETE